ncbi:MAG: radical SAM protein [Beijerinckiaceae bacterium]
MSAPLHNFTPDGALIESGAGRHLFVADGSRIYDLDASTTGDIDIAVLIEAAHAPPLPGIAFLRRIDGRPLPPPPLQTLSLNVAQSCNLACGYCYADGGGFGGHAKTMSAATARMAVDRLILESHPGSGLVVGFMGGEPFLARDVMYEAVAYATARAGETGHSVRFSVTTNGTMLTDADIVFLHDHSFQVSISIDGPAETHDRARRTKSGRGSYARIIDALERMARLGRPRHLSARATVTPRSGDVPAIVDHLIGLSFDSVGVAPVLTSPVPNDNYNGEDFSRLLAGMIATGRRTAEAIHRGQRYPFSNFETAMQELHRGTHRPYPCGAGAAYLSVGANGDMFACHRFIDDPSMRMGHVAAGLDQLSRERHLADRHVDRQEPCRSCWARYLCGGACHHEVIRRGRVGCDYIRSWLSYCIGAYAELSQSAPGYFEAPETYFDVGFSNEANFAEGELR